MTMFRSLLLLPFLVALAACGGAAGPVERADDGAPASTVQPTAGLDDTLRIDLGAERTADRGNVRVRFVARVNDSRCPANAMCVWQGDAAVRLQVRVGSESRDTILHTSLQPSTLAIGGYTLSVPGLTPYPGTYPEGTDPKPTVLVRVVHP